MTIYDFSSHLTLQSLNGSVGGKFLVLTCDTPWPLAQRPVFLLILGAQLVPFKLPVVFRKNTQQQTGTYGFDSQMTADHRGLGRV